MSPRSSKSTTSTEADAATQEAQADAQEMSASKEAALAAEAVVEAEAVAMATAEEIANNRIKAEQSDYAPALERPAIRRPADARVNAFNPVAWLVDGATGVLEEARHSDLGLSEDFWVHFYAMRREGLLAAQAAVNSLLDKVTPDKEKSQARRGSVSIDF